jgi:hypothetical protein
MYFPRRFVPTANYTTRKSGIGSGPKYKSELKAGAFQKSHTPTLR